MKKLSLTVLMSLGLWAVTVPQNQWQMVGTGTGFDFNTSSLAKNAHILWYWDGSAGWKGYSGDATIKSRLEELGYLGDRVKDGQGFWVSFADNKTLKPFYPAIETLPTTRGWHLVSFSDGLDIDEIFNNNYASIAWVYRNNRWSYKTTEAGNVHNFSNGEGGWIYLDHDLDNIPLKWVKQKPVRNEFKNKELTFEDGSYLKLDQNGSMDTNNSNITDYNSWDLIEYNEGMGNLKLKLTSNDKTKAAILSVYRDYEMGSWVLDKLIYQKQKIYPTGVVAVLDRNVTDPYVSVMIEDINKTHEIETNVKEAMDELDNMFENGVDDGTTKLNNIQSTLAGYPDNSDAKVALAVIKIVTALQDESVSNVLDIKNWHDDTILGTANFDNIVKYLPVDSELDLKYNISNFSSNTRQFLKVAAEKLKEAADLLQAPSNDKNYIFHYAPLGENNWDFAKIKAMRASALSLAYQLQFIASYQLGDDSMFTVHTETIDGVSVEYRQSDVDPVACWNSGHILGNPSQSDLDKAKAYLKSALEIWKEVANLPKSQRGDILTPNNIREIFMALDNLNGKNDGFVYIEDEAYYTPEKLTYKKTVRKIDLNPLFDATQTITINDFPAFHYTGEFNLTQNKLRGESGSFDIENSDTFDITKVKTNIFKWEKEISKEYNSTSSF
jgi:hypothetical protein